ncbi:MAG: MFS transporter [Oscillospiraceae bacterium]|nr:MFS transporter [Oscillospiraceae bacterium]
MEDKITDKSVRRNQIIAAVLCNVLMIVLGMSDSLRGVFAPIFKDTFELSAAKVSMIISVSYAGNLIFLFVGGKLLDTFKKKYVMLGTLLLWMSALLLYFFTKSYTLLLCGMIFSMGASTLLSTSVNLITPILFMSPGFMMNIFNFTQGVGISGGQNVAAKFADGFRSWQVINIIMFAVGIIALFLILAVKIPDVKKENETAKPTTYMSVVKNPAFIWLILMCGFYYIPEHGLQNWLPTYASEYLGFPLSKASFFTGLFYAFMTIGRLVFAVLVNKLGPKKSLFGFSVLYSVLYITGVALGRNGMYILAAAGLGNSIMWPMFVYLIQLYYPPESRGKAVGLITGLSTFFDIGFNALFGVISEQIGYGLSIWILPVASVLFLVPFGILTFGFKKKCKMYS